MRLAKHLAHAGVASRRAAEVMIAEGRVTVDGETVTDPARGVTGAEAITVDGSALGGPPRRVVYALHKPAGVVSTAHDTHGRPTVVDLVPEAGTRLYPVGRLDADTTGLILLTNDGDLANHLMHPRYEVPRTYRAKVGAGRWATPRCAGCARASSSTTGGPPRRASAACAPTCSRSRSARAASGRCGGWARPSGTRCSRCGAPRSARWTSATAPRARTGA